MTIEDFEKAKSQIIGSDSEIQTAWLGYLSAFPHVSEFFRAVLCKGFLKPFSTPIASL